MPKVASGSAPLSGLFAIDKPSGAITMKLLNALKELLETSDTFAVPEKADSGNNGRWKKRKRSRPGSSVKLGQGGTLDPLASGVLVIGLNDGTKKLGNYLHGTKEYRATGLLGSATDSYDSDGKRVKSAPHAHVTQEKVESVLAKFRGEIKQLPPIYSAIKMDGMPLYEYARQGKPLPKPIEARSCTIHQLELLSFKKGGEHGWKGAKEEISAEEKENMLRLERLVAESAPKAEGAVSAVTEPEQTASETSATQPDETEPPSAFEIRMTVSSGTYVRSLVHDIGIALGSAAHVVELIRTRQGQYALDPAAAHTVEGEDSKESLQATVPWSVLEEGIEQMKAKKQKRGAGGEATDGQTAPEAESTDSEAMPAWEDAIVKAVR